MNFLKFYFCLQAQMIAGWSVAISTMFVLVYGVYLIEMDRLVAAAHSSLSHTVWALGLAWVVIACSTGHGGYIDDFLSAKALFPVRLPSI
jgi:hypothetical protein